MGMTDGCRCDFRDVYYDGLPARATMGMDLRVR